MPLHDDLETDFIYFEHHPHGKGLIEESKSGMSIMTYLPVKVGSILRIECKGSWMVSRYATVQWCQEVAPNNYRCGLFVSEYY